MSRLFGTDGVRGLANGDLTAGLALDLSVAAAHVLADLGEFEGHRPLAVVGRDPRISGQFLEAAVVAGLASAGVDVLLLGVLPTPGVAFLTATLGADLGVVLSASHNPMPDNGIKFFARGGLKLDDAIEIAIERRMAEEFDRPTGGAVGRVTPYPAAVDDYAAHLVRSIDHPLAGLTVVLDCADGAAYEVGPRALEDAGAKVIAIHAAPDGLNINEGCGSTHLEPSAPPCSSTAPTSASRSTATPTAAWPSTTRAPSSTATSCSRCSPVDEGGRHPRQGHRGGDRDEQPRLRARDARAGVGVRQTKVGDRYVLQAMQVSGYTLGGEQSGHVILTDYATTGDGILAALQVLERMVTTGRTLKSLASVVTRLPQTLVNVPDVDKSRVEEDGILAAAARRGGGRARRRRPDPAPALRHRAHRAGDGRGRHPGRRRRHRQPARRRRPTPPRPLSGRPMNLLRRIASLPGLRRVLLHPAVRRQVAAVLALRFAVAARRTTTPVRLLLNDTSGHRGHTDTYVIRATGVPVVMQHGRDLEALFELFERGEYEPPGEFGHAARRLARSADHRRRGQRRHVLRVGDGPLARRGHHRLRARARQRPDLPSVGSRPRPRHVHRGSRRLLPTGRWLRRRPRWRLPRSRPRLGRRGARGRRLPPPARRRLRQDRHRGR